jgi:hypothetical protein
MTPGTLHEPARETPVLGDYDVVVLGGGPAGIMAATAAAALGCQTLLVEHYGFLGGMGTAAGVTNFCGLHANVFGEVQQVVHGLTDELLERMRQLDGLNTPHSLFGGKIAAQAYDNAAFKVAADQLTTSRGVQLLFHSRAVGVSLTSTRELQALLLETKSGRCAVRAQRFIDCSGDGDMFAHAGVGFEKGETGADMMYPSSMFRVQGVDPAKAGDAWNHFGEWMAQAEAKGRRFPRKSPIIRPQKNPSEWRANVTQLSRANGEPIDGTDVLQLSAAELQGRAQIVDFLSFLREYAPGFEKAYLLEIAPQVGIRETRRMVGAYQLSETDVLDCVSFEDSIGVNGWMIEEHVAGNVSFRWQDIPNCRGYNQLPYRMLLPLEIDNLLVAGRCASMTHGGQSAARVSGACFAMGQAAGTAAALSLKHQQRPQDLSVPALQDQLKRDGAFLG